MIQIVFKNLDKSELAKEAVFDRVGDLIAKFPELQTSKIVVTLEMLNSPQQAGVDVFSVKFRVGSGRYGGISLEKSSRSMYVALADVVDHALERLNRYGDRKRVVERGQARRNSG